MKTHDIGILLCSMLTLPVQAQHRLSGKVDTENIIDLNMGQYSRTVSVKFVYRFGGSINKEKKEVDASRFGHWTMI